LFCKVINLNGFKSRVLWGLPLQRKVVIRREFILFGCNSCGWSVWSGLRGGLGGVTDFRAGSTSFVFRRDGGDSTENHSSFYHGKSIGEENLKTSSLENRRVPALHVCAIRRGRSLCRPYGAGRPVSRSMSQRFRAGLGLCSPYGTGDERRHKARSHTQPAPEGRYQPSPGRKAWVPAATSRRTP
jgi:hypothetical protein